MRAQQNFHKEYGQVLMMSAWGFSIVVASFLFLYLGYQLDQWLNTPPTFMFGLFFLALVTSIGRLYQEAWRRKKDV
jgi:F0F1-type ATP synthase assembly protein I